MSIHEKVLVALSKLARGCHAPREPAKVMDGVLDCLLDIMGAERGFILASAAIAPGTNEASRAAGLMACVSRAVDDPNGDPISRGVVAWVTQQKLPLFVADTTTDDRFRAPTPPRTVLATPILRDGVVVGAIYLDAPAPSHAVTAEDRSLLEAAATHALAAIERARDRERLAQRAARLEAVVAQEVTRVFESRAIVGQSDATRGLRAQIERLAPAPTPLLIVGEPGTGKELVARALHAQSGRAHAPFIAVHMAGLPSELLESALFGHERGALPDAADQRMGRFELADGGTLYLDEVADLDEGLQAKLCRVFQDRIIERVGDPEPRPVDVRIIAATRVSLAARVAAGTFRPDLFHYLSTHPLEVPPLRDRRADVPALATHFARLLAPRLGRKFTGWTAEALARLGTHSWPGNVRELRNTVERALVLNEGPLVCAESLPLPATPPLTGPLAAAVDAFERRYILECLERHAGDVARASDELAVPRPQIERKLETWGLRQHATN